MHITEKDVPVSFHKGVKEAEALGSAGQREALMGWPETSCLTSKCAEVFFLE